MHIGLNLVYLVPGETGGTETYARELIPELVRAAPKTRFTAFVSREAAKEADSPWGGIITAVTVPVRAHNRFEWVRGEQELLPRLAGREGVNLVHSLANTGPAWGRFRRVVTIHDLHYRVVPEAHLRPLRYGMGVLVPLAARRSDRVIVPSQSTAADVHRFLGTATSKVDVVSMGLGTRSTTNAVPEKELRRMLGVGSRPIVLSVSAKRPHKNLARLIGALALISLERRPVLVVPGYPTQYEAELRELAARRGVDDDVRWLGWVDESELEGLYAAAACCVLPSLYEGFGLPVLEAMARGVPVACSERGSLAEVAGNAALRFDPESEPGIARVIERLISDASEAERLRAAGRAQAERFSWAATAAGTLAAYERVLASAP